MPGKKKRKKEDKTIEEEDIIEFKPSPRQISKKIKDESGKITEYVFKRWTYGESLDAMTNSTKSIGLGTELDNKEYIFAMMEATIKKPKMTRRELQDLDPRVGMELFRWCQYVNMPGADFQRLLAGLQKNQ